MTLQPSPPKTKAHCRTTALPGDPETDTWSFIKEKKGC